MSQLGGFFLKAEAEGEWSELRRGHCKASECWRKKLTLKVGESGLAADKGSGGLNGAGGAQSAAGNRSSAEERGGHCDGLFMRETSN